MPPEEKASVEAGELQEGLTKPVREDSYTVVKKTEISFTLECRICESVTVFKESALRDGDVFYSGSGDCHKGYCPVCSAVSNATIHFESAEDVTKAFLEPAPEPDPEIRCHS